MRVIVEDAQGNQHIVEAPDPQQPMEAPTELPPGKAGMQHPYRENPYRTAEEYARITGKPQRTVLQSVGDDFRELGFGVAQTTGMFTNDRDKERERREQKIIEENRKLTSPLTALGAFGLQLGLGAVGPNLARKGITKLNKFIQRKTADDFVEKTPFAESIKSFSDRLNYTGGSPFPLGPGGFIGGSASGFVHPVDPDTENIWKDKLSQALAFGVAGKGLDTLMTAGSTLPNLSRAVRRERDLISGDGQLLELPRDLRFPRHIMTKNPADEQRWNKAKTGTLGPGSQAAAINAERRMDVRLENNTRLIRNALGGDPKARREIGLSKTEAGIPPTIKTGGTWQEPMNNIRDTAAKLKAHGKDL